MEAEDQPGTMPLANSVTIEEGKSFIEKLPLITETEGVVPEIPKEEELNKIPTKANPDPAVCLLQDIADWLKRKEPRTCTEILRHALMAYATSKELEHQDGMLPTGVPQSPPPVKKLCVRISRQFYEEIKKDTLARERKTLPQCSNDDDDDSSSDEDSMEAAEPGEAQKEAKDMPMPLNFDFATPSCGQLLRVQLIVPSVFLDLVAAKLEQMDVDQKKIFSIDDLVQLGRIYAAQVSLDYDKMLRTKLWIVAMQKRCGVDWQEFPLIEESLRDPDFGKPAQDVVPPPQRPQTHELLLNGSRKVLIRMHKRN